MKDEEMKAEGKYSTTTFHFIHFLIKYSVENPFKQTECYLNVVCLDLNLGKLTPQFYC